MSLQLISRSTDLKRLRDEGYDIEVKAAHLLVKQVPYVTPERKVSRGMLVVPLGDVAGDRTHPPSDHTAYFSGETPSNADGTEFPHIIDKETRVLAEGLEVNFRFSSKPPGGSYPDFYEKMTTYVTMLTAQARRIDPGVTAQTHPVIATSEDESVFNYLDTASSRAGIVAITEKLEKLGRVAIVGLGGTGSYILDLIAKTPVREIHLFDGDRFISHNAFRSPGAASLEELRAAPLKVTYFRDVYSRMRRGVVAHEYYVDASRTAELREMDFVFLSFDGEVKKQLVESLIESGVPFIDVGLGVHQAEGALLGIVRVTTATKEKHDHVVASNRIPFAEAGVADEYGTNIQVADLNALNAALAVVRWKKLFGFYADLEREHFSAYTIDGNHLLNEEQS